MANIRASFARLSLSASSNSSQSSVDSDYQDALQYSDSSRKDYSISEPSTQTVATYPQKFTRYHSKRVVAAKVAEDAPMAEAVPKKSMSRYKRTRPTKPPPPAAVLAKPKKAPSSCLSGADGADATDYTDSARSEAYRALTGGEQDPRPNARINTLSRSTSTNTQETLVPPGGRRPLPVAEHEVSGPATESQVSPMKPQNLDILEGGSNAVPPKTYTQAHPSTSNSTDYEEPRSPERRIGSRPGTAKSTGTESWQSSMNSSQYPSQTHSISSSWQAISSESSSPDRVKHTEPADSAPKRRIAAYLEARRIEVDMTSLSTAEDVLNFAAVQLQGLFDPGTAILAESLPKLGLERPLRHYERIAPVLNSWDHDDQYKLLILTPTDLSNATIPASQDMDAEAGARGLDIASAPSQRPKERQMTVQYLNKHGRWQSRIATLRPDGQITVAAHRDATTAERSRIGHMADSDAYIVTGKRRHALRLSRSSRYIVAIKSQHKAAFFEEPADYVHFFASDDKATARAWWTTLRDWRSWYLCWELGWGRPEAEAGTLASTSSPIHNAPAITQRSVAPPARPTVALSPKHDSPNLSRAKSTRSTAPAGPLLHFASPPPDLPARGLVGLTQNADPAYDIDHSSAARELTAHIPHHSPSNVRATSDDKGGGTPTPLVDLSAPSTFATGSLLERVEREQAAEREAARQRRQRYLGGMARR